MTQPLAVLSKEFPKIPAVLAEFRPRVALVLGSGLGSFADACDHIFEISYAEIPGLPISKVPGHAGKFVGASLGGIPLLLAMGRVHFYEGHTAQTVAAPIRFMAQLQPSVLILTNAAGTLNRDFAPGGWMILNDHLNLTGISPLSGGPNFFDMTEIYTQELRDLFREQALSLGWSLPEGVYACVPGPQYETPAEVRMLRTLGADVVGMSTVFEAIQARALGLRVAAFSCLTNWAAGISTAPLSHAEVMEVGQQAAAKLCSLLQVALPKQEFA